MHLLPLQSGQVRLTTHTISRLLYDEEYNVGLYVKQLQYVPAYILNELFMSEQKSMADLVKWHSPELCH